MAAAAAGSVVLDVVGAAEEKAVAEAKEETGVSAMAKGEKEACMIGSADAIGKKKKNEKQTELIRIILEKEREVAEVEAAAAAAASAPDGHVSGGEKAKAKKGGEAEPMYVIMAACGSGFSRTCPFPPSLPKCVWVPARVARNSGLPACTPAVLCLKSTALPSLWPARPWLLALPSCRSGRNLLPGLEMREMTVASDIRAKTPDELTSLLLDLRKEQFNLRFQRATGQQENTSRVRAVRRDIARVKTILAERARSAVAG